MDLFTVLGPVIDSGRAPADRAEKIAIARNAHVRTGDAETDAGVVGLLLRQSPVPPDQVAAEFRDGLNHVGEIFERLPFVSIGQFDQASILKGIQ